MARNILLIVASLVFYAFGEPMAVFIMVGSIILNYFLGRLVTIDKFSKPAVITAVVLNIGLLVVFKYLGFLTETLNTVTGLCLPVPDIRLPIGISFFTFQCLSYVIDIYRDKTQVQKNLLYVFLYISFFPQLIAGPIVKYHDIKDQLAVREFSADRVSSGIARFLVGLGKKVLIANTIGIIADEVFSASINDVGCISAWIGAVCYTLQIFFDFSGYSDMAIGLGKIFGFDFRENFNYPYAADSMKDFWRRWHISVSTWFKEYVYFPLGGNRKGNARANLNRCIVFFLTGLWHGANLTFVVWGLMHGFFLLLENTKFFPKDKKWFKPIGHIYTLAVVIITFVIFRADNLTQGFGIIKAMFTGTQGTEALNSQIRFLISPMVITAVCAGIIFSTPIIPFIKKKLIAVSGKLLSVSQYFYYLATLCIFVVCVLSLSSSDYNPFIYFRF